LCRVFQRCVEEVDLRGEANVDAEWVAYLGGFCNLRSLNLAECRSLNNHALWPVSGTDFFLMTNFIILVTFEYLLVELLHCVRLD